MKSLSSRYPHDLVHTLCRHRLLPAVNTTTGTAIASWAVTKVNKRLGGATVGGYTNLAEAGTLSMEFSSVTHLTGEKDGTCRVRVGCACR